MITLELFVRKSNYVPSRKLLIIYNHYTVPSNDTGDVYTVNSYDAARFKDDVPPADLLRSSDTLDFRPRVSDFTLQHFPLIIQQELLLQQELILLYWSHQMKVL